MRLNVRLAGNGGASSLLKPRMIKRNSLPDSLFIQESPGCADGPRHIVVVMDGMRDFTTEPLEWTLKNTITPGCTVTLLGVMPWLNIPLSAKMWLDVWPVGFEDLPTLEEKIEWKHDVKYLKLLAVRDLCIGYGVVPHKEVIMGYPPRLLVVEKITGLHATWVVFDRHQRKNREFYSQRIPCKMVMMNESGEADMIKETDIGSNTSGLSPASSILTPKLSFQTN